MTRGLVDPEDTIIELSTPVDPEATIIELSTPAPEVENQTFR